MEACGDAETTEGYTSRDEADTCAKGKGCEVGGNNTNGATHL